jgi:transcriptional regulator with XRE-family HTH domain
MARATSTGALREQVGGLVRFHRQARNMTQVRLAEQAGKSQEMINKIERGRAEPSFATLEALSEALDVPVRAFFGPPNADDGDQLSEIALALTKMKAEDRATALRMMRGAANLGPQRSRT